jgi:putative membrane protein
LILAQICYPLVGDGGRSTLVIATVLLGFAGSLTHALTTRGFGPGLRLLAVTAGGGFAVEAIGVATGFPFGQYAYDNGLGPQLLGVPLIIPLAWTWMAWPAWLAAGQLTTRRATRVAVAGIGLASWDLFLDPQMVAAGYWHWSGTDGVPLTNYLGWLIVATVMMAALPESTVDRGRDAPMLVVYLWTYASSVLAHAVFLDLAWSALWGGLGMGVVAIPLAVRLAQR